MARVTSLAINVMTHWNGRGLRQARRNLNQFGDGMNDASRDANKLNRDINKMNRSSKMLARSLKRPRRDLNRLGDGMNDANRDTNRFRRSLRALGRGMLAPFRGLRNLRRGFHNFADDMTVVNRRSRALRGAFRGLALRGMVALGIAMIPVIEHLARLSAGLIAMGAAAAIGFGGFAALALLASKRAFQLHEANKKMSKSQREHVSAVNGLRKAWNKFADSKVGGKLLVPINIAIKAITRNMHKLKPLVNAIAPIFRRIARAFASWMDRRDGFSRFVRHMKKHGVPIMRNLARAARSVLKFLGRVFRDSLPLAKKLSKRIREGARALAKWAAKGGFRRWLNHTKKNSPQVRKFFRELKRLLPKLLEAFRELAPVMLRVATLFLRIANRLSPGQLKALILLWLLAKPALVGFRIALAGVNFALWLHRKRAKKAGGAVGDAGKSAKKSKGKFGKLGSTLKTVGKRFGGLAATLFVALIPAMGRLLGKLGGGTGLTAMLRGAGLAGAGATFAMGMLNLKHGKLSLSIDDTIDSIIEEWHQLQNLGDAAVDAAGGLKDAASSAWSAVTPWHDGGDDDVKKGGNAFKGLGKGAQRAADATKNYANKIKPANKRTKRLANEVSKGKKVFTGFGSTMRVTGNRADKMGKSAGKAKGPLARLAQQSGFSKKELKKMGIGADDARKMLGKFGTGAVNTGKKVKNKAGRHFKNGAKNVRNSWDKATIHIRRTTRKRFDKVIHHTRAFRNKLGKQFKKIGHTIRHHFGKATESVADNARKRFNKAERQAKQLRKTVGKQFHRTADAIRRHWGRATDSVRDNARKRFNKAENQAKQFRKTVGKQFHRTADAIRRHWGRATESVQDNARKRFNKTIGRVKNFRQEVGNQFERLAGKVRKAWSDMLDNVKNRAKKRLGEIRKTIDGALKKMRQSFDKTADAIKKIWQGRLPSIFKKPVKFFVEVVYNKGLRKAWNNTFAKLPGIKKLDAAKVGFAQGGEVKKQKLATGGLANRGGRVRGAGGPTQDKIDARLSAGEYVVRAKAVKQIGVDVLNRINQGVGGDMPKRGVPKRSDHHRKSVANSHFADGGVLGSRSRHNHCSYYTPMKFAEGGFIPYPSVDINEFRKRGIAKGVKLAKKSKMLGSTAMFNFSGGNMSNSDDKEGFDWGANLYQDVAKKVARAVLMPYVTMPRKAANSGNFRPAHQWALYPPERLNSIMDQLVEMIHAAANVGCGSNGYAPFRPWRSGDGARVSFRGVTLNRRTRDMCLASEKKLRKRMSYFQGSFSHASASAGTHAGGGAVDVGPASFQTSGAMRASGFAAWARGSKFGSGSFSPHVHGIAVGDKQLSGPARAQVKSFFAGKDGLAGNRPDNQPGGGGSCAIPGGSGVKRWAGLAAVALRLGGCPAGAGNVRELLDLMRQESGGNPRAQNNWDSNARAGNASRGLMQVIPTTFRANHVKGTSWNIFDPLANMAASVRYIKRQYGCRIPNAPYAQGGFVTGGRPRGGHPLGFCSGGGVGLMRGMVPARVFDSGGWLRPGLNLLDNRTGGPEHLTRTDNGGHHDGCGVTVIFKDKVYAKSDREMRDLVIEAVAEGKRRGRIGK